VTLLQLLQYLRRRYPDEPCLILRQTTVNKAESYNTACKYEAALEGLAEADKFRFSSANPVCAL
jgi:hypothetical protein